MLYLIIPPAVIIIGLALLLFFLSRKISNFSNEESARLSEESQQAKIAKRLKKISFSKVSAITFSFLEIISQWFKVLFLKSHNIADKCFRSIKEKKIKNGLDSSQKSFLKKETARKFIPRSLLARKKIKKAGKSNRETNDINNRPMVSRKAAQPEDFRGQSAAVKDKLEETLIERIAINPRDLEAYERLGDYYIERQNFKDALECYRQVLKLSPVNYKARVKIRKLKKFLNS
ncbi:tetratricopeptide repeat protein [bacterium]|nr:tetratricopeptide repeat protein [bacterium]